MLLYKGLDFEADHKWLVMGYLFWLFSGKKTEAPIQDSCMSWDTDLVLSVSLISHLDIAENLLYEVAIHQWFG